MHWAQVLEGVCKAVSQIMPLRTAAPALILPASAPGSLSLCWAPSPGPVFAYQKGPLNTPLRDNTSAFLISSANLIPYRKFCCVWNLCFQPVELVLHLGHHAQEDA